MFGTNIVGHRMFLVRSFPDMIFRIWSDHFLKVVKLFLNMGRSFPKVARLFANMARSFSESGQVVPNMATQFSKLVRLFSKSGQTN